MPDTPTTDEYETTAPPWPSLPLSVHTASGLHGQLIALKPNADDTGAWAVVRRYDAPVPECPYSVHYLSTTYRGDVQATAGRYDLSREGALLLLDRMVA